jgi:hypothetical protein
MAVREVETHGVLVQEVDIVDRELEERADASGDYLALQQLVVRAWGSL